MVDESVVVSDRFKPAKIGDPHEPPKESDRLGVLQAAGSNEQRVTGVRVKTVKGHRRTLGQLALRSLLSIVPVPSCTWTLQQVSCDFPWFLQTNRRVACDL